MQPQTYPEYVFLLGGHDLEMAEIRKLLEQHSLPYHDGGLSWNNATLSAYKDIWDDQRFFVGIELREDISPPPKYISIDHHNERSDEPASIAQVAKLLGITIDRWQQLVAANDRGFIPAMERMGATTLRAGDIKPEWLRRTIITIDLKANQ
ncbi:MAG: hypothetical protein WD077_10520 [Bacteroidia bacterium]